MIYKVKNFSKIIFLIIFSLGVSLIFCETVLRVKHYLIPNYDIEMWKYAKSLKVKSENIKIGHVHKKNRSEILQKVEIKVNNFGQRDIDIDNKILEKYERSFLILGSSIPLGWGVENSKVMSNQLNKISNDKGKEWLFINGGIGNYNTERYVNNYLENWSDLNFTDIVIVFFVNDTEILTNKDANFFIKHSHFAVIVWKLVNSYKSKFKKENLESYYKELFDDNYSGLLIAKQNLMKFKEHCDEKKVNCYIVNMPDIHQLKPYKLEFINVKIKKLADEIGFKFYDLLKVFDGINEKDLWNDYNDPHPNAYAHELIAKNIYDFFVN